MSDTSVRHYILVTCIATFFLFTPPAIADWSGESSHNRYNKQFGDFPPDDIDQHIKNSLDKYGTPSEAAPTLSTNQENPTQSIPTPPQNYQLPEYRNNNQQGNYYSRPDNYRKNYNGPQSYNSGFSGPWNNNGSNFNMPWGNSNGSSFNMPWGNNNGSNFSMPWGGNNNYNNGYR